MNLNLTDYQLRAIGLLSVRWSYLETEIDFTVSALASAVEGDQRIPHRFSDKTKRWRKLARAIYDDTTYQEADKIIREAKQIHDARCLVLHGRVYRNDNEKRGQMVLETHRHLDEWRAQAATLRVSGILSACDEIAACYDKLQAFNKKHFLASPQTLPRMCS